MLNKLLIVGYNIAGLVLTLRVAEHMSPAAALAFFISAFALEAAVVAAQLSPPARTAPRAPASR